MSAQKDRQKIEVTIPIKGNTIRAEESSSDMYVSIDLVEEVIERQIRRYRKKLIDRKQAAVSFSQAFIEEEDELPDDEIQIVKTKKFAIKPTNPEEACLQMEMLGHSFYVFLNSDTASNVHVSLIRVTVLLPQRINNLSPGNDPFRKREQPWITGSNQELVPISLKIRPNARKTTKDVPPA